MLKSLQNKIRESRKEKAEFKALEREAFQKAFTEERLKLKEEHARDRANAAHEKGIKKAHEPSIGKKILKGLAKTGEATGKALVKAGESASKQQTKTTITTQIPKKKGKGKQPKLALEQPIIQGELQDPEHHYQKAQEVLFGKQKKRRGGSFGF